MTNLRNQIWAASGRNLYAITIAACRVGQSIPCDNYDPVLTEILRMKQEPIQRSQAYPGAQPAVIDHDHKKRYLDAHLDYYRLEFPNVVKDGFYSSPKIPDTSTSGGLTTFIINYLTWSGCYGNRINTTGRKIFDKKKNKEIWIKGSTKKGTGDIVASINGRMVFFEIKVGKDTPSDKQIEQQAKVRRSGGEYFFIHNTNEFFSCYDAVKWG